MFDEGKMLPPFEKACFSASKTGLINNIVTTDFGFHIIKISEKYDAVLLGTIAQKIEPSETTIDQIYTQASKFEADANEKGFEATSSFKINRQDYGVIYKSSMADMVLSDDLEITIAIKS
mgnify:CR=1 FL=1